ncbi:MAG: tyrosine recombinase XerC [Ruminococcus sp.]|nr:tyrosine recombinase XerC [Ruminococcus sp.]
MKVNNSNNPEFLNDYLVHIKVTKLLSERTIQEYYFDIRMFLKYILLTFENSDITDISDVDISRFPQSYLKKITISDLYNFIFYVSDERENKERARYRKACAIRSFFKYLNKTVAIIDNNPAADLEIPSPKPALPKYLSLDESVKLLNTADNVDSTRDFCIITLFLNCGIRLSELVGIDLDDIDFSENKMKVLGKGNKERIIFLNPACIDAINNYIPIRNKMNPSDEKALFLSSRKHRISKRRVQQIVENTLSKAELANKGITTHKLRHTAATLMYQYGETDILTLKEVLGHASTSTTEIYTHLSNDIVRNAFESNPLAQLTKKNKNNK